MNNGEKSIKFVRRVVKGHSESTASQVFYRVAINDKKFPVFLNKWY